MVDVGVTGEHGPGFAVIDVETTGFSPEVERIIEVGVVLLDPWGGQTGAFCTLVDPGRDPGPTHIHGISAEMLSGAPTFAAIHPYLADRLSGRVVVGHNVDDFDLSFIRAECRRAGGGDWFLAGCPQWTPSRWPRPIWDCRGGPGWSTAAAVTGCPGTITTARSGDARATVALFRSMRAELGDRVLGIAGLLALAGTSTWPGPSHALPFVRGRPQSLAG